MLTKRQKTEILRRCRKSFTYFCKNFCKIKHPNAGIIPFNLFKYQKKSIKEFNFLVIIEDPSWATALAIGALIANVFSMGLVYIESSKTQDEY